MAEPYGIHDELDELLDQAMAESMKPVELSNARRNELRDRIVARTGAVPPPGTRTVRAHEGQWRQVLPLVHEKILRRDHIDRTQTALYRLDPGAVLPPHVHTSEEECLVLNGEIEADGHVVRAGDMHIASRGCTHPALESKTGALLLIRSQIIEFPY